MALILYTCTAEPQLINVIYEQIEMEEYINIFIHLITNEFLLPKMVLEYYGKLLFKYELR
jgi:hypothetical protein